MRDGSLARECGRGGDRQGRGVSRDATRVTYVLLLPVLGVHGIRPGVGHLGGCIGVRCDDKKKWKEMREVELVSPSVSSHRQTDKQGRDPGKQNSRGWCGLSPTSPRPPQRNGTIRRRSTKSRAEWGFDERQPPHARRGFPSRPCPPGVMCARRPCRQVSSRVCPSNNIPTPPLPLWLFCDPQRTGEARSAACDGGLGSPA